MHVPKTIRLSSKAQDALAMLAAVHLKDKTDKRNLSVKFTLSQLITVALENLAVEAERNPEQVMGYLVQNALK